jgi:uncharacterized membrane protein YgcG
MTDHDHNEVARRLRETGTVPAPERLRAEVMDQVRAEPRLRPSRRSFFRPALPYAAAAAMLAIAVFALSHVDLGSGGSSSSGASGGGIAAGGASASPPERSADGGTLTPDKVARDQTEFHLSAAAAQDLTATTSPYAQRTGHTVVIVVPPSLYAEYKQRLHTIEQRSGGHSFRVILRKAP